MRKKLQKMYDESELILNTGMSFLFVSDLERRKYKEMGLPSNNNGTISADIIMTQSEWEELVALMEQDNKPFSTGTINGNEVVLYDTTEYNMIEEIERYKKVSYVHESQISMSPIMICDEWELLSSEDKELINKLIKRMVNKK